VTAIRGLALLLLLQAAGEAVTHALNLPFPGPVVGMVLLLGCLSFESIRTSVGAAADVLLANLSLLFVPVGVGVITHLDLVSAYGIPLLMIIVFSTLLGMATTALIMRAMTRPGEAEEDRG